MAKTKAPDTLGATGKTMWAQVTESYELRADELRTLEDACAASDMLAAFSKAWNEQGQPLTTKGSMGQLVEHPLIGSIDKQRKARQAFLRQLKLPDLPSTGQPAKSNQQRSAAQTRWAAAHGAGA